MGVNNIENHMGDMRCTTFSTDMEQMVELGENDERFEWFMMPLTDETGHCSKGVTSHSPR